MRQRLVITQHNPVDEHLITAFWRYDDALLADDVVVLDELFADSPSTFRVDGRQLLMGHQAISAFRSSRTQPPTRRVTRVFARTLDRHTAVITAVTRASTGHGSEGFQTQVWQHGDGQWKIVAAHVSTPPPAVTPATFDRTVWRCVGDPLVPATGSGVLDGTSLAVKDLFAVAGFRRGAGNPGWLAEAPIEGVTAAAVSALLAAGADIAGITQTDEFAYGLDGANAHYGAPPNPRHPALLSGGSSSGTATAVAHGWAELGVGSDTAGSIRVPASFQGLYGLRTTHGLVNSAGMLPLAPSFDTVGLLAGSAGVLDRAISILAPTQDGGHLPARTVVIPALTGIAAPEVRQHFSAWIQRLARDGLLAPVETVEISPPELDLWLRSFRTVQAAEAWRQHGNWIMQHPGALGNAVAERFSVAAAVTTDEHDAAREVLDRARSTLQNLTRQAVLAVPTCPAVAPSRTSTAQYRHVFRTATMRLTSPASIAGLPAISLPLLGGEAGSVGLCLISRAHSDSALTSVATHIETHLRDPGPDS